jgi:hypothetical protein
MVNSPSDITTYDNVSKEVLLSDSNASKTLVAEELLRIKDQLDESPMAAKFAWIDRMIAYSKFVHGEKPLVQVNVNMELEEWNRRHSEFFKLKPAKVIKDVGEDF